MASLTPKQRKELARKGRGGAVKSDKATQGSPTEVGTKGREVKEMTYLSRLAVLLLLAARVATAGDDELSRPSLKGLKGVYVLVESLQAEAERSGLSQTSIQTDVELKLRQAGITVLTQAEMLEAPGGPHLYISVNTQSSQSGLLYAYSIRVALCQDVRLDRDPSIRIFSATTWFVASVGTAGRNRLRDIRDMVKDDVDTFINAYLSVNPKK
jgi:hypothetical protein